MIGAVGVFCGSSFGDRELYRQAAEEAGREIARRGWTLVYGGASVGLMGAVADAALLAAGRVVGVIPRALVAYEIAHGRLSELRVVESMHERKALMADLSDAFLALPGGYGTWDELCEILTWGQLGIHTKPCGLLNSDGYYDGLLAQRDRAVQDGFLQPVHAASLLVDTNVSGILGQLATHRPVLRSKLASLPR